MNDLQEQLSSSRIENENRTINRFGRQVTLERLVDGDSVHVGVIDEPDNLITEELSVVLRTEVRLGGLGTVQLQTFSDTLSQDMGNERLGVAFIL